MIKAPRNFWSRVDRAGGPTACWPWTGSLTAHGYGQTSVFMDGRWRGAPASAVAYFLDTGRWERAAEGRCVRHACDNRRCCNPAHLLGGTVRENARDKAERGLWRGERCAQSKLDDAAVADIRRRVQLGETMRSIAALHAVASSTVQRVSKGYSWRHRPEAVTEPLQRRGKAHPSAIFSDDDVREIRRRAAAGEGVRALARDLETNPSVISRIVARKTWAHLE